jgi:hypothetical protein
VKIWQKRFPKLALLFIEMLDVFLQNGEISFNPVTLGPLEVAVGSRGAHQIKPHSQSTAAHQIKPCTSWSRWICFSVMRRRRILSVEQTLRQNLLL